MGNIASPTLTLSPVAALEALWEGKMPVFESADDAQALFGALIGGLWNRLAEHQSSRHPFRLVRAPVAITRPALSALALMRKQEIAFKDVLDRLPTHPASRIDDLLPHRWTPPG